ncbi:MAG TPA: DUF1015 domain-containing protein [Candidatus Nitrosotalea sp.]|nr:DUF1015 domain-containing protein [Candidatus Nitrosotalea sp.]
MADVRGFRAIRCAGPLEPAVAPPYDVLDEDQVASLKARSEHNIVHLTRPGRDYDGSAALLRKWLQEGSWIQESEPVMMLHETRWAGAVRRDLIAALRLQPYEDRVVLPHERTHRGPKEDRLALLRATGTSLEPLWFLYQDLPGLMSGAPLQDRVDFRFQDQDHTLYTIRDAGFMSEVSLAFAQRPVLIADGHHRYETTLAYSQELGGAEEAASRFTLACLTDIADPGLTVLPTHRVLRSGLPVRGGDPVADLTSALAALEAGPATAVYQAGAFEIFRLEGGEAVMELHRQILDNVVGRRTAEEALEYTRDAAEAVRWVDEGRGVAAFLLPAPDVSAILKVAEQGQTMPQKATYFHPKPPSGMALHQLDPGRNIGTGSTG